MGDEQQVDGERQPEQRAAMRHHPPALSIAAMIATLTAGRNASMTPEDETNSPSFALSRQRAVVANDTASRASMPGCAGGLQRRPDGFVGADEGAGDFERTQQDHHRSCDPQGTRQHDDAADQTTP
jgi:hypothetical protein